MRTLTDQENTQVEQGMAAEKLCADPLFTYVMTQLGNAYMDGIISSTQDQKEVREGFYHSIKAIQDIGQTLAHWVQVKETIVASLNTDHTED